MNPSKRAILHGAADVIEQIAKDEEQDLKDQPDNIELDPCSDAFRANVSDLRAAVALIREVIIYNG
jgi:hypothetical protein